MYTIYTEGRMPRTNEPNGTYAHLSLRLKGEEAEKYRRVLAIGLARNNFADKAHVIRELIGLDPPQLLTPQEIEEFRGRPGC